MLGRFWIAPDAVVAVVVGCVALAYSTRPCDMAARRGGSSLSTSFPRPTVARRIADAITLLLCLGLMVTGIVTSFW
jgi:hypothetical protein